MRFAIRVAAVPGAKARFVRPVGDEPEFSRVFRRGEDVHANEARGVFDQVRPSAAGARGRVGDEAEVGRVCGRGEDVQANEARGVLDHVRPSAEGLRDVGFHAVAYAEAADGNVVRLHSAEVITANQQT